MPLFNLKDCLQALCMKVSDTLDLSVFQKMTDWQEPSTLGQHNGIYSLIVLPTGEVVSASDDKTLKVWDLLTKTCLHTLTSHTERVTRLAVLPTGEVVSASDDKTIKVWNPLTGQCLNTLRGHTAAVWGLAVLPTGEVVSASNYSSSVWDGDDGSGTSHSILKVWNPLTGNCLQTIMEYTYNISTLVVLPTGKVVSGSRNGALKVWNPLTGECLHTLTGHTQWINRLVVLPTGEVISGGMDSVIGVWNPETGTCLYALRGHKNSITDLAVLPTGTVVSGSRDGTLKVWDPLAGVCIHTLSGHKERIVGLAVLPTGEVVSASSDKTLKVWSPWTGACLHTFTRYRSYVNSFALLPRGELLVHEGNTLKIWNPSTRCALSYEDIAPIFDALIASPGHLRHVNLTGIGLGSPQAYSHLLQVIEANPQLQTLLLDHTGLTSEERQHVAEKQTHLRRKEENIILLPVEVPNNYLCPITREIMFQPVMAVDGCIYEEEAIMLYFEVYGLNARSPLTGLPFQSTVLFPNPAVRALIHEFLERHPEFLDEGQNREKGQKQKVYFSERLQRNALQAIQACDERGLLAYIAQDKRLLTRIFYGSFLISHVLNQQDDDFLRALLEEGLTSVQRAIVLQQQPIGTWLEEIALLSLTSADGGAELLNTFLEAMETAQAITYPAKCFIGIGFKHHSTAFLELGFTRLGGVNRPLDEKGNTALHHAIMQGDKVLVRLLLELKAYYSVKNNAGQKPRDLALALGHQEIVNQLTDAKIIPTLQRLGIFEQLQQLQQLLQQANH